MRRICKVKPSSLQNYIHIPILMYIMLMHLIRKDIGNEYITLILSQTASLINPIILHINLVNAFRGSFLELAGEFLKPLGSGILGFWWFVH